MKRVPPPLLALTAAVAQRALAGGPSAPSAARGAASAGVALASISLDGAAGLGFRRSRTTVNPFHPELSSTLVTTGVNAITRNPMYVGMAGLLVAHAIWRGSWTALAPVAAFVLVIDRTQVPAEEAALVASFGASYDAYRAAVPRWLDARSIRGLGSRRDTRVPSAAGRA